MMIIHRFKDYKLNELKIDFLDNIFYLKEMPQCGDIPYNKQMKCQKCGHADFFKSYTYDIVGFCYTNAGFMAVFECKNCGYQYKHHVSADKFSLEDFKEQVGMILSNKKKKGILA